MKTIALLRHAKSDWGDAFQSDRERPLAPRGQVDAPRMGRWIAQNLALDLALVSPAKRAEETFAATGLDVAHRVEERLYPTQSGNVLRILQGLPDDVDTVLLVGHNPGISNSARNFLSAPPDDPKMEDMPTCACAILQFDVQNWRDVDFSQATLAGFMTPKRL